MIWGFLVRLFQHPPDGKFHLHWLICRSSHWITEITSTLPRLQVMMGETTRRTASGSCTTSRRKRGKFHNTRHVYMFYFMIMAGWSCCLNQLGKYMGPWSETYRLPLVIRAGEHISVYCFLQPLPPRIHKNSRILQHNHWSI